MKFNLILIVAGFFGQISSLQAQWNGTTTFSNVGIGTNPTGDPLTVYGNSDEVASFANNSTNNTRIVVRNQTGVLSLGIGNSTKYSYAWSNTNGFFIGDDGAPTLMVAGMNNGKVGIGTTNPRDKLDIWGGTIQVTGADLNGTFVAGSEAGNAYMSCNSVKTIFISPIGNVGIGTNDTKGYKFAVNGSAVFAKVVVKDPQSWPDYVFNSGYKLPSLVEVEEYIKQNHHLPEVVAAEDVEKNGLDVGNNQAILLKKVEELTLYMIDQSKKQQKLEEEVAELKKENRALRELVGKKKK